MSKDDHNNRQRRARDDVDNPTRDANGRWLPGHCPNPKGRPKKQPTVLLNQSDIRWFSTEMIEVGVNGEPVLLERSAALLSKMFECAMKGDGPMQRYVYREFEKNREHLATVRLYYDELISKWYLNNEDRHKPGYKIPIDVELEIISLRSMLNHYYPGAYPSHEISGQEARQ